MIYEVHRVENWGKSRVEDWKWHDKYTSDRVYETDLPYPPAQQCDCRSLFIMQYMHNIVYAPAIQPWGTWIWSVLTWQSANQKRGPDSLTCWAPERNLNIDKTQLTWALVLKIPNICKIFDVGAVCVDWCGSSMWEHISLSMWSCLTDRLMTRCPSLGGWARGRIACDKIYLKAIS